MRSLQFLVLAAALTVSPWPSAWGSTLSDQENCLDQAMARHAEAKEAATAAMQLGSTRCDDDRSSWESADRCYLIVARKYEAALRGADAILAADRSACLH